MIIVDPMQEESEALAKERKGLLTIIARPAPACKTGHRFKAWQIVRKKAREDLRRMTP